MKFKAKNILSTRELFEQRKGYSDFYKSNKEDKVKSMDLWNEKLLYGRVNNQGKSIYVSEENLVEIPNGVFVLDIVEEAYNNLQQEVDRYRLLSRIDLENTSIFPLRPFKAWESIHAEYHSFMEEMYKGFTISFLDKKRDEQIVDYPSFEKKFLEYYTSIASSFCLNRSAFVTSSRCSILNTGLAIEFSALRHDEDQNKYDVYVNDIEYDLYKKIANQFGFVVDKNAPWRLVLDLNSEPAKELLRKRDINGTKDFFNKYFLVAHKEDMEVTARYLHKLYNTFVTNNPIIKIRTNCEAGYKKIQREPIQLREFFSRYDINHWANFYVRTRNLESQKNYDEITIKKIITRTVEMSRFKSVEEASDDLQKIFAGFDSKNNNTNSLTSSDDNVSVVAEKLQTEY